jgi:hypothetical protein
MSTRRNAEKILWSKHPSLYEYLGMRIKPTKQECEDRACEAIICGILRGWGQKEWARVFRKVDEIEAKRTCRNSERPSVQKRTK